MLVDEFQDTSALQTEILGLIADFGFTTFFLVGDPEQSIYSFAGAEPRLMDTFSAKLKAKEFPLSGNFRSSDPVVLCAESLIPRSPTMIAVGSTATCTEKPQRIDAATPFQGITDEFLPVVEALKIPLGKSAILAPTWYQLMPLGKQLRNYGVPIVGPGPRPYKRRHLLVGLVEQVCAYLEKPEGTIVRQVEKELFILIQNLTGKADFRVYQFHGRRAVFEILRTCRALWENNESARDWLDVAATSISAILVEEGLLPHSSAATLQESAADIVRDMEGQKDVDVANLTLADLGMFACPDENLKLLTLHGAKGREFRAVAIIALHDGRIPYHNKHNPLTQAGLDESRRLFYVGITRAKRVLMLFTDSEDYRGPSPFLREIGF